MLSETHVTKEFNDYEISIDGYQLIRCDSSSRHTGGVAMYLRNGIEYSVVHNEQKSKTWILSVKISEKSIDGHFAVTYKSPKEKINDFLIIFDEFLETKVEDNNKNIIIGDMNIDVAKHTKNSKKYLKEITHNLKQIVDEFTRVDMKNDTKTIIDHVLTNSEDVSYIIDKDENISDH